MYKIFPHNKHISNTRCLFHGQDGGITYKWQFFSLSSGDHERSWGDKTVKSEGLHHVLVEHYFTRKRLQEGEGNELGMNLFEPWMNFREGCSWCESVSKKFPRWKSDLKCKVFGNFVDFRPFFSNINVRLVKINKNSPEWTLPCSPWPEQEEPMDQGVKRDRQQQHLASSPLCPPII